MKLFLFCSTVAFYFFSFADTSIPNTFRANCTSPKLGQIEVILSEPQQVTLGCSAYQIQLIRRNNLGQTLETRDSKTEQLDESFFYAKYCTGDSSIHFVLPPTHVDWSKHPNECWVNSQFSGVEMDLDINTGAVAEGDSVSYTLQELNPNSVYKTVSQFPYYNQVPFLNDKRCNELSTSVDPKQYPTCKAE